MGIPEVVEHSRLIASPAIPVLSVRVPSLPSSAFLLQPRYWGRAPEPLLCLVGRASCPHEPRALLVSALLCFYPACPEGSRRVLLPLAVMPTSASLQCRSGQLCQFNASYAYVRQPPELGRVGREICQVPAFLQRPSGASSSSTPSFTLLHCHVRSVSPK